MSPNMKFIGSVSDPVKRFVGRSFAHFLYSVSGLSPFISVLPVNRNVRVLTHEIRVYDANRVRRLGPVFQGRWHSHIGNRILQPEFSLSDSNPIWKIKHPAILAIQHALYVNGTLVLKSNSYYMVPGLLVYACRFKSRKHITASERKPHC